MRGFSKILIAGAGAALVFSPPTASAATLIIDGNGELTGATGVLVNGASFDVTFADGTCAELFSGCDSASDFAFQNQAAAAAAGQALLAQVFITDTRGNFDQDPSRTAGCSDAPFCLSFIPFGGNGSFMSAAGVFNSAIESSDGLAFFGRDTTTSSSIFSFENFAVFNASAPAVPEPTTWAMMLIGFGAVGGAMRSAKRKQKLTVSYS